MSSWDRLETWHKRAKIIGGILIALIGGASFVAVRENSYARKHEVQPVLAEHDRRLVKLESKLDLMLEILQRMAVHQGVDIPPEQP